MADKAMAWEQQQLGCKGGLTSPKGWPSSDVSLNLAESDLPILQRIKTPLWILDIDRKRVVWANRSALALWLADSMAELAARDMSADMSISVAARLKQYQEDFLADNAAAFDEICTIYPKGK